MASFMSCMNLLPSGFEKFYAHGGQEEEKRYSVSDIFIGRGWRAREAAISAGGLFVCLSSAAVAVDVFIRPSTPDLLFFSPGNENSAITMVFYSAIVVVTIIIRTLRKD